MSIVTTSRRATPEEMQAEIDRMREAYAALYDENAALRAEVAKLKSDLAWYERRFP